MPIDIPVAKIFPTWIRDTAFPRPSTVNAGAANIGTNSPAAYDKWRGQPTPAYVNAVAASIQAQWIIHRGIPGIRMVPTAANVSGYKFGENLLIILSGMATVAERLEFAENAAQTRVWIDEFYFASDVALALTVDDYVAYGPRSGADAPNLSALGAADSFGFRGNAAGTGWDWVSFQGVVLQETVALTWPASTLDQWVKVQFVIADTTATSDANVRLFLNNTLVITRSWGVGTVLPIYSGNFIHMPRVIVAGDNLGRTLFASRFRSRAGVFDQAGIELVG